MAILSVLGIYERNNSLFDNLQIPQGLDKNVLVTNILLECAELEVLYPDYEVLKIAIDSWSASMVHQWQKMYNVLYEEYDPFINIRRHEERTITQSRDLQTSTNTNGSSTNKVNAWDTDDPVQANKTEDVNTATGSDTGTVTTHEEYDLEGDSAITDAQDVAKKEIELRAEYNMYKIITDDFKSRFCLLVY